MGELFTKLWILVLHLGHAYTEWREYIWKHELDEYHCCNGGDGYWNACGCGGMTIRDFWMPEQKQESPESSGAK